MSLQKRKTIQHFNDPGHAHFLTFSCHGRMPLLTKDRTRKWLIEAVGRSSEKHDFAVLAYVIMPEHAHLLILPRKQDYDIAGILKTIKQSVAKKAKQFLELNDREWLERLTVRKGDRKVFRFWQSGPGYDRNIKDDDEFLEKIKYIHENPVKRGLVDRPEEWEWSSAGGSTDKLALSVCRKSTDKLRLTVAPR
jgi:putative transposase